MSHFTKSLRPPRSMTSNEAQSLLDASGRYAEHFPVHLIFSIALGTGLRLHEIQALNIGQIYTPEGRIRSRVRLTVFKGCRRSGGTQEIHVPPGLATKFRKFYDMRQRAGQSLDPEAPLFTTRKKGRISGRHMSRLLKCWLDEAELDPTLRFHELRHTAISLFQERVNRLPLTQRMSRHRDIRTAMVYVHANDEAMAQAMRGQLC